MDVDEKDKNLQHNKDLYKYQQLGLISNAQFSRAYKAAV